MLGYLYGKGLAQIKPEPIGRSDDGRGRVRVEKQAVECKDPKWRPVRRKGAMWKRRGAMEW